MATVLVTGARGFLGRNLCSRLRTMETVQSVELDVENTADDLARALECCDVIVHLAGVNRPQKEEEFRVVNTVYTEKICDILRDSGRTPKILLSSSTQAELDNPYGASKRAAETALRSFADETGAECVVYRLKNLFGKWCRPNYNSVTATFCHNIAHGIPILISDPETKLELTYIDDVVEAFICDLLPGPPGFRFAPPLPGVWVSLGQLAEKIRFFKEMRSSLKLPDFSTEFERALYATFMSYMEAKEFAYGLKIKSDQRGSLAEFLKSPSIGQIFVSRSRPGVTRGDHYHQTKAEKFLVVEGEAIIRLRQIESRDVIKYHVRGEDYRVLDIPPGYAHSIENVGRGELVTLFWSDQMFDPEHPDTYFEPVLKTPSAHGQPQLDKDRT